MITNKDEVNAMRVMFYQTQMRERFTDQQLISSYKLAMADLINMLVNELNSFKELDSKITHADLIVKLTAITDYKELVKHLKETE